MTIPLTRPKLESERGADPFPVPVPAVPIERKIYSIHFLRAFAAILVVQQHAIHEVMEFANRNGNKAGLLPLDGTFRACVFFVISGFVLREVSIRRAGDPGYAWQFLADRIRRVVPLYWIFTSLTLLSLIFFKGQMSHSDMDVHHALASYAFIPYPRPYDGVLSPVLGVGWTLNYEMFFYLVFSCVLFFKPKSLTLGVLLAMFIASGVHQLSGDYHQLYYITRPIIWLFAFGVAVSYISSLTNFRITMTDLQFVLVVICLYVLRGIVSIWFGRYIDQFILAPALVAFCAFTKINGLQNIFSRTITFIGNASYSVYLSHIFTINVLLICFRRIEMQKFVNYNIMVTICIVISIAIGCLIYLYIEKNLAKFFNLAKKKLSGTSKERSKI